MTDPTADPMADPSPVHLTPSGMLHLRTWLPPELHEPFSAWCDTHHLEQLEVPGFRRVRRFSLVRSTAVDPPGYLTVYDLDDLSVLEGDAYAAYQERSTGLPDFLRGRLRAARSETRVVERVPPVEGLTPDSPALVHLFVPASVPPDPGFADEALAEWFAQHVTTLLRATGATSTGLLRTPFGDQIVVVELDEVPDARDSFDLTGLPRPDVASGAADGATGWGVYRLDYAAAATTTAATTTTSTAGGPRGAVGANRPDS